MLFPRVEADWAIDHLGPTGSQRARLRLQFLGEVGSVATAVFDGTSEPDVMRPECNKD
jgi:hypothetical protein